MLLIGAAAISSYHKVFAQGNQQNQQQPKADIINSKYLTIKDLSRGGMRIFYHK